MRAPGWVTIIEAFITTTIPGSLLLLGEWDSISGAVAIGTGFTTILVFALLAARSARRSPAAPLTTKRALTGTFERSAG
jgi:putative amide transporter protein